MRNRTLRWMNIYEETWVCKRTVKSVLHRKSCFLFIKTFQDSSALLPSWNTMEQWELVFFPYLKLSAWGNIFAVIARQWTILSYFEAFLKKLYKNMYFQLQIQLKKFWIIKLTQRILVFKATRLPALRELVAFSASVPQVFFTGWTEKW